MIIMWVWVHIINENLSSCTQKLHQFQNQSTKSPKPIEFRPPSQSAKAIINQAAGAVQNQILWNNHSLPSVLKHKSESKDEPFTLNIDDIQLMVNQLNVQCTLSKKKIQPIATWLLKVTEGVIYIFCLMIYIQLT